MGTQDGGFVSDSDTNRQDLTRVVGTQNSRDETLTVTDISSVDDWGEVMQVDFSDGSWLLMLQTQYDAIAVLAGRHPRHDVAPAAVVSDRNPK